MDKRRIVVQFPAVGRDFSVLQSVEACSGTLPASYSVGAESCFIVLKGTERAADPLPTLSSEVNNEWSYTYTSPCLHSGKRLTSFKEFAL
jgi:hypothetical protein